MSTHTAPRLPRLSLDAIARDAEVIQEGGRHFLMIELTPEALDALAMIGADAEDREEGGDHEEIADDEPTFQPPTGAGGNLPSVIYQNLETAFMDEARAKRRQ